ncbi:MAG: LegC family aminotransferase [Muribaculaceae bacterium]|nr:LegC family aminotransferase [Muribaculaceae bacterium]
MSFTKEVEFIRHLYNAPAGNTVALHAPTFAGNEKRYLEECIDTTFVSSVGPFVDRFERDIAEYTGAAAAVVCVSGTAALHVALMMAGVERGDEVITQPLTFVATCNALNCMGAIPVFVDVDLDTMGLSPDALEQWIVENTTEGPGGKRINKTTGNTVMAVVPMHTFGHPVRIRQIQQICNRYGLALVEDAAESIGSTVDGKHTGTFGSVGAMSFNGNKTITTGGGGILLFDNPDTAARAKHITTQAKVPHRWEFVHDSAAFNYRMPNINAALGCAQLEQIDRFLQSKRATAEAYSRFFADNGNGIRFMSEPAGTRSNYWLCAIMMPDRESRDAFLQFTNDNGVMTRPIWELMNRLPMWSNAQTDSLTNCYRLADTIVNIPSSVRL